MPSQATGQVCPDSGKGLPQRVIVTSVCVPGLGVELETDTGEPFAVARDQRTAWLIAGAVNAHLQTLTNPNSQPSAQQGEAA